MKKILFLTAAVCFFYACKPVKLNFESNYSQWRLDCDSDIVHNVDNGLVFDFFDEESLQSLYNEGMDDEKRYHWFMLWCLHGQSKDALEKMQLGRNQYFINRALFEILSKIPCDVDHSAIEVITDDRGKIAGVRN